MIAGTETGVGKPELGAAVYYRGRQWTVTACDDERQLAEIKLPGCTRKYDTSLTVAWKHLRGEEAISA